MNFRELLKKHIVYLDGGIGTLLQAKGLKIGEFPETWNLSHPEIVTDIHKAYFDAGSHVVCTNTFGANSLKFSEDMLEELVKAAVANAKAARDASVAPQEKFIALDIGPTGKLLKPFGDLDFEDAVRIFSQTVSLGVKFGVDLIMIETMNDSYETKAAVLAAKENSELPVLVSNAYDADGKLMTGATPEAMVAMLEGLGVDALGANCSLGPHQLGPIAERMLAKASVPVILKPNAGLPKSIDGRTFFDITMDAFSDEIAKWIEKGVRVVGGCCGTTPEYIRSVCEKSQGMIPVPTAEKNLTVVSSYSHTVEFGQKPILIGERINPTGKKRFKQALIENDMDYILSEGVQQQEKGVHILDVNVGLLDIDEAAMLKKTVCELQAIIDLPLQIDTANAAAMEQALRCYNGKAMINSVSGKTESMEAIFPLVKKYGGVVVALTLDENGIPPTAEGRVAIAQKILSRAAEYGIPKKDIIFDTLTLTVSADSGAVATTLAALKTIKEEFGCHTSLGVSNVSFGLPNRDAINATFFALALENGLSAAIINPYSADMMKTYYTYNALKGLDENFGAYLAVAETFVSGEKTVDTPQSGHPRCASECQYAIIKGFKEKAAECTKQLLVNTPPLEIVNNEIIPALNQMGKGFEDKTVYLPQLLMSAEAAKYAFETIKAHMQKEESVGSSDVFVLATVRGDIHDIGKNIVKLLLENYGFTVVDLGKDVPPEAIVEKTVELHAAIVGLSALMTTTVPEMEETIRLLRIQAPWCKIVVGGAVLTQEYADKIGADKYAKDAMEGVRYAQNILR